MISSEPGWEKPLERMMTATSLLEAQIATAELIDVAIPGGSAAADDGADLVSAIASIPDLPRHPYRAYFMWVLVLLRRWAGVWQALIDSGNTHELPRRAALLEVQTTTELARAAQALRPMMHDSDPEVRSMAYRLLGSASNSPGGIAESLIDAARSEGDDLAKGCAVEAVLVALAREWPKVDQSARGWVLNEVHFGSIAIRGRIRHVIDGHAFVGIRDDAVKILGEAVNLLPEVEGPFWIVECV